jgi:hypothetical protein
MRRVGDVEELHAKLRQLELAPASQQSTMTLRVHRHDPYPSG